MSALAIAWLVAGAAGFACLATLLSGRAASARATVAEAEAQDARGDLKSMRKQLEKRERQKPGKGDEVGDLRRRLEKAKKRTAQLLEQRRSEPEQIASLETELEESRAELRGTRDEVTHLQAQLQQPPPPVATAAPEAPPPKAAPSEQEEVERQRALAELAALRGRVAELEAELGVAKQLAETSRTRIKTQDKLYLAIRGELEVKKDRLQRQQEELERLMAMRVSLLPDPVVEGESSRGDV